MFCLQEEEIFVGPKISYKTLMTQSVKLSVFTREAVFLYPSSAAKAPMHWRSGGLSNPLPKVRKWCNTRKCQSRTVPRPGTRCPEPCPALRGWPGRAGAAGPRLRRGEGARAGSVLAGSRWSSVPAGSRAGSVRAGSLRARSLQDLCGLGPCRVSVDSVPAGCQWTRSLL